MESDQNFSPAVIKKFPALLRRSFIVSVILIVLSLYLRMSNENGVDVQGIFDESLDSLDNEYSHENDDRLLRIMKKTLKSTPVCTPRFKIRVIDRENTSIINTNAFQLTGIPQNIEFNGKFLHLKHCILESSTSGYFYRLEKVKGEYFLIYGSERSKYEHLSASIAECIKYKLSPRAMFYKSSYGLKKKYLIFEESPLNLAVKAWDIYKLSLFLPDSGPQDCASVTEISQNHEWSYSSTQNSKRRQKEDESRNTFCECLKDEDLDPSSEEKLSKLLD